MIKAVIFDIGGTLFRSDTVEKNREFNAGKKLLKFFKNNGIDFKLSPWELVNKIDEGEKKFKSWSKENGFVDISPYTLFSKWIFKGLTITKANDLRLKIIAPNAINLWKMCGTPEIREGAAPMLKKLKSMNYKLGIISNTVSPTNVIIRLFKNNIYQYFEEDAIFLSTSSQYRKPGTEIFLAATSTLCVKPSEAIYVGDRINKDVVGSRAAKYLASVRILPERAPTDGPEKKHEDTKYIIKKLSELPNMIKKISNIKFKSN